MTLCAVIAYAIVIHRVHTEVIRVGMTQHAVAVVGCWQGNMIGGQRFHRTFERRS
jgi:hypothetical protein